MPVGQCCLVAEGFPHVGLGWLLLGEVPTPAPWQAQTCPCDGARGQVGHAPQGATMGCMDASVGAR